MEHAGELLSAWNGFYVMIGSAAAALTGLMFVVITLIRDNDRVPSEDGVSTFSTPTVVHFCCPLFTAAVMSAPFRSVLPVSILLGLTGLAGLVYAGGIALRSTRLDSYEPDAEDIAWHFVLPIIAYAMLVGGAIAMDYATTLALFAPAAAATLLIFIGIHNAWDVVTYLATGRANDDTESLMPKDAAAQKETSAPPES